MSGTFPSPAWIVGCGKMAGAMVEGWQRAGLDMSGVLAIRPSGKSVEGLEVATAIPADKSPSFVMLGVKPQMIDEVAPELAPRIGQETTLVSILAGVELSSLATRFPDAGRIVRAMPNLPVSEGEGVTALIAGDGVEHDDIGALFAHLGLAPWAASEEQFGAIGGLAGSGPAYVARFVAALAKAGVGQGLDSALADRLALQTVSGTAQMAMRSGEAMDDLATRVASPKGTTEQGLKVLDEDSALDRLLERVLEAAAERSRELAEAARRP